MQLIKKSALFALVLSSALICGQQVQAAKPSAAPAQETTLEVKAKLDAFAKSYVARANDTLKNNRQNMSVTKQGKGYVARYTEVDASTMTTEIYPGKGPGCEYVGHIVYLEKVYECTGKTISEAKTGTFTTPKARRIRELENPALAGIPILAMTANAFDEDRRNALECGMNGFLSKPIVIADLVQEMRKFL